MEVNKPLVIGELLHLLEQSLDCAFDSIKRSSTWNLMNDITKEKLDLWIMFTIFLKHEVPALELSINQVI